MTHRCIDCRVPLTPNEHTYYEVYCEMCAGEAVDRMDAALSEDDMRLLAYKRAAFLDRAIEAAAAAAGVAGAYLLAAKGAHAGFGWWALLASNFGWIAFAVIRRHWFLLLQQVGFTATSLLGISRWML